MTIKTLLDYSPNFNPRKRKPNQIKFIIFHYTGMKKESSAISRLTEIQSEVSSHYLIKKNGEIISLVPDLYIAWHAGVSSWKNQTHLNKNSIGIEITNPGHEFGYKKFTKKQINSLIILSSYLIKKYRIAKNNILGHSDVSIDRKKDPGENFPWKYLAKKKIGVWHKIKKDRLLLLRKKRCNQLMKKIFIKNLIKFGYCKKINSLNGNKKYSKLITKSFQRRFRQELINGIIDQECLLISQNLTK